MSHECRAGVIAILLSALVGPPAAGAEDPVADLFTRTAREEGVVYRVGADLLYRQGKAIEPLLKEKEKGADWRERDLARYLRLRLTEPEKVAAWSQLFHYGNQPPTFAQDGAILIPLPPAELAAAEKSDKVPLRDGKAVLDAQAVPLLLAYLRGEGRGALNGSGAQTVWGRVLDVIARLAPADAAPGLVETLERLGGRAPGVEDALVKIGRPAVAVLHDAVRTCPLGVPKTDTEQARRDWMRMMAAPAVARTLARLGDKDTAALLLEKLDRIEYGDQVEAYCAALAALKSVEGMPAVFAQVLQAAGPAGRESWTFKRLDYSAVRRAMLGYGPAAREFLREKAGDKHPTLTRAVATGLLFELDNPDEAAACYRAAAEHLHADAGADLLERGREIFWWPSYAPREPDRPGPAALRIERAMVYGQPIDLRHLTRIPNNPLAFDIVSAGLLRGYQPGYEHVTLGLVESGDKRTLDTLRQILEVPRPDERLLTAAVEALLLLGDAKAVPVLEALVKRSDEAKVGGHNPYAPAAEVARAVLPALRGNADHVVTLLKSDQPSVRAAAASYLARKGDLRALPVLLQGATTPGPRRVDLRNDLVRLGKPAVPLLEKEQKATADARIRLMCEAAALRITKPELVAKLNKAVAVRDPGWGSRAGPDVGTYRGSGTRIAAAVGREAIPLLEELASFDDEPPGPGVAIFALAHFKEDRSLPVVVAAGARVGPVRSGNLVAAALRDFGEKGIEAAKTIPAPDPDKERFAERAGRHRAGTEALALEKDIRGVDNILDGLKLPLPDRNKPDYYQAQYRAQTYLRFAAKYEDKRLIEPLLKVAEAGDKELTLLALEALAGYDDKRIVPLAVKWLGPAHEPFYANRALRVLVRQLGPEVVPLLTGRLLKEADESERLAAARALGNLGSHGYSHWTARYKDKEQAEKAEADALTPALDALLKALGDARPAVQAAVAEALVDWGTTWPNHAIRSKRPVKPLADRVAAGAEASTKVIRYLVASQDAAAGPALLAAYRASKHRNYELAQALGQLKYADAVPDLIRGLDLGLAGGEYTQGYNELEALAYIGGAGLEKVHETLKTARLMPPRWHAAELLGRYQVAKAYPDVAALFEAVASAGPNAAYLQGNNASQRADRYVVVLTRLAESLARLDPRAAHTLFAREFFTSKERSLSGVLAAQLKKLEDARPELKQRPVPAPEKGR
jgi:HEAT repeat protein